MNTKELIEKASNGTISKVEVKHVYDALINQEGDEYDLLLILGRAEAKQYKGDVEKYLNAFHDPMLARLALQILCRYWGFAAEYEPALEQFIKGVDWDDEEDVRIMAIGCVTEVFKDIDSPKLLRCVYGVFASEEEDEITRGCAYETLAIVSGKSVTELPQPIHFDLESDIDLSIIKHVEEILSAV